jgi:catechol 2,3-dioxygenase-like lactoylglutathione lyase family enzyme
MSRIQLALNVGDLDEAVAFYSKLFATEPAKRRPGYANFAIAEPPLKLVLIEGGGDPGTINHLGVEVFSTSEVAEAASRLQAEGLRIDEEHETTCCYAVQDKVWVSGPDASRWEVYTVLADANEEASLGCATDACTTLSADDARPVASGTPVGAASSSCC